MEINPWNVESIEAFSYFKCPECSFLSQVKKYFEDHAVKNHILSTVLFGKGIENLHHDDELTSEKCESIIIEGTPKLSNQLEINDSYDSFEEDGSDDKNEDRFEDHSMIRDRKMRVPIIKTEECETDVVIDDGSNNFFEEVDTNTDPLTLANMVKGGFEDISKKSRSKPFGCNDCHVRFERKGKLMKHVLSVHEGKISHKCSICEICFSCKEQLQIHFSAVHEEKNCETSNTDSDQTEGNFEDVSKKYKSKVWDHFLLNRNDSLAKCMFCSALLKAQFGTRGLHGHLTAKHSIKVFKLNEQSKDFDDFKINNHEFLNDTPLAEDDQVPTPPLSDKTEDDDCNYNFEEQPNISPEEEGFKDISEKSKSKVWDHFLFNRIDSQAKCNYCSAVLKASGSFGTTGLHGHLTAKHSIKVFKLNEQSKIFEDLKTNNHKFLNDTSKSNKSVECNYCNAKFLIKYKLKRHILSVHEGSKPHQCVICGKAYSRKEELKVHVTSVHEQKKPYMCDICGNCFVEKKRVRRHIKMVHENGKPYRCSYCKSSFTKNDELESHIKSKHESETNQNNVLPEDHEGSQFKDISKTSKSKIWAHFLLNHVNWKAQCVHCSSILKVSGGSTRGLHKHMKSKHSIRVPKLDNGRLKRKISSAHEVIKPNDEKCAKKHVKAVHEKKPKQSFKCFKCDAVFWESKMFKKHVVEQHGEKSFEDISEKSKSQVWGHFLLNRTDSNARCLHCYKLLKVSGGSTKGLHRHIKSKHSIVVSKVNELKEPYNTHFDNGDIFQSHNVNSLNSDEVPFQNGVSPALPKW